MENTHFIDKEPNRYEALAELQKQSIQSMNEETIKNLLIILRFIGISGQRIIEMLVSWGTGNSSTSIIMTIITTQLRQR